MNDTPRLGVLAVLCAVAVATVAGLSHKSPPPRPTPTPTLRSAAVTGTLREGYTGRPIDSGDMILGDYDSLEFKVVSAAKLDAGGRFRFAQVTASESLILRWRPDDAAKKRLLGADAYRGTEDRSQEVEAAPGAGGVEDFVYLEKAVGKSLELGTVHVWLEAPATEAFAPVCTTGRAGGLAPAATAAVFLRNDGRGEHFTVANFRQHGLLPLWPAAWKGVACIIETRRKVGTYRDELGRGSTDAYSITWKVRVVRLPEGKTLRTTISADPPQAIKLNGSGQRADGGSGDVEGDPTPLLRSWLAKAQAKG